MPESGGPLTKGNAGEGPSGEFVGVPPGGLNERSDEATLRTLAAIIADSNDAVISQSLEGWITSWNRGAERLLGYSAEQIVGKSTRLLIPSERLGEENRVLAAIRRGEKVQHFESQRRTLDGRIVEVSITVSPIHNSAGQIVGVSHIARDITRRKSAEQQLRLQSAALAIAADGIVITERNGFIQWVNAAFCRMTGYSPQEAIGLRTRVLKSGRHDQAFYRQMWETVLRGDVWHGELVNRRKDGSCYDEEMTITPVRDEGGHITHFVAIKRDISERKKAENALREAQQELEKANVRLEEKVEQRTAKLREAISELEHMSYSMIHDMRAPLRAMQGFATLVQEEYAGALKPEGVDHLNRIRESANRLDRLIVDALNYNRVVREELPINTVEVGSLLRGMLESYPNLHPPVAKIRIEFEQLKVRGNKSLLTQCFGNLLGNAVKFVPPGIKPQVRVRAEEDGEMVRLWVEDNGIGIPKQAQELIFRMFQRMHRESEYPGTGIGLTIVKKAAERMGGRVGVESEPGKGSRFWVELRRGE